MWIYIIVFEGAYGTQIEKVFTNKKKAEDYIKTLNKFYNYEIIETFAL
jgi:hypothetical protein